jgi:hypothetical protein
MYVDMYSETREADHSSYILDTAAPVMADRTSPEQEQEQVHFKLFIVNRYGALFALVSRRFALMRKLCDHVVARPNFVELEQGLVTRHIYLGPLPPTSTSTSTSTKGRVLVPCAANSDAITTTTQQVTTRRKKCGQRFQTF